MMKIRIAAFAALMLASGSIAQDVPLSDDQTAMKAPVVFLASDTMRGLEGSGKAADGDVRPRRNKRDFPGLLHTGDGAE